MNKELMLNPWQRFSEDVSNLEISSNMRKGNDVAIKHKRLSKNSDNQLQYMKNRVGCDLNGTTSVNMQWHNVVESQVLHVAPIAKW